MIEKSFRLSNGFWHKFFPNSNKLFSPQNILLEIWDICKRVKESKWNSGMYGIENLTFSNKGDKFVISGGWVTSEPPKKSEFKIFETDSLNCIDEIFLAEEKCTNPIFTNDDKKLVFGTWEGNIYTYSLEEKTLTNQYSLAGHMFNLIHHGKHHGKLYISTIKLGGQDKYPEHFIFEYDVLKNRGDRIHFSGNPNPYISGKTGSTLKGLALSNDNLAIITVSYGEKENRELIGKANCYVYNISTRIMKPVKEDYQVPRIFCDYNCVVWNNSGSKLAFVGRHAIYVIDFENDNEIILPFESATSVEFSNCNAGLAVGGKKAKIFKIE